MAVGSTPGHVDVWDIEKRTKLYSLDGGTTVALSPDGRLLAKDGNGIEICDAATGKLIRRIPWSITTSTPGVQRTIKKLEFNAAGSQLEVSSNGENDLVFSVSSGQLVATLTSTQQGEFSRDGTVFVGGNGKHLIAWSTNDWSKVSEVPNGPDYVTQIAAFPGKGKREGAAGDCGDSRAGINTLRAIASELNAREVDAPRGGQWSAVQVQRVIARKKLSVAA